MKSKKQKIKMYKRNGKRKCLITYFIGSYLTNLIAVITCYLLLFQCVVFKFVVFCFFLYLCFFFVFGVRAEWS